MGKSSVLVVGGTGFIGRRIVKASLAQGHPTYVLARWDELGMNVEKLELLHSLKKQGTCIIEASFSDHQSLVEAVKQVDVVVSTVSGVKSGYFLMQLKLVDAIKEAGNVKRFLPSEFGMDPSRMRDALSPGNETFEQKMVVRKAIEEANIPFTYVSANCFGTYFAGNLCQMGALVPPKHLVRLYGDGNTKAIYVDEDDVATYTIKAIEDPRTLNKTLHLRPPENILSQNELIHTWEKLTGKILEKISIPAQDFLDSMKGMDYYGQVAAGHVYHIYYEGCLTNFEIGKDGVEASQLYPEVKYIRMNEYMKIYL